MTSFIVKAHLNRRIHPDWLKQGAEVKMLEDDPATCTFCRIIEGKLAARKVFENERVVAFLDIMPIRRGHVLVVPKAHFMRLSDLPEEDASALGAAVSKVCKALVNALEHSALNVVCNQEYAQAVPHVHYHIIPAPKIGSATEEVSYSFSQPPVSLGAVHRMEIEGRDELDDEDATTLVKAIASRM
ncbi:HIT-like domain-containing protein [Schizophyllum amplum]|uniref:HIT-like domain-containing protein n=1 Tax=Schizophyllum amplum TaxID=97359 RepID=A0A550C8K2_9AGAR|nr:HIT-like domain-containing protein [Auriculariopsis ampla]